MVHAEPLPEALATAPRPRNSGRMTSHRTTCHDEADRTAADVAWDLEPLVDGAGAAGVDALLDDAEARAHDAGDVPRARSRELDADGLAELMRELAAIGELAGRAGLVRRACGSRSTPPIPPTAR